MKTLLSTLLQIISGLIAIALVFVFFFFTFKLMLMINTNVAYIYGLIYWVVILVIFAQSSADNL